MRHLLSVIAAALLAGCASIPHEAWSKSGTTQSAAAADVIDCRRAAVEPNHGESCAKIDGFPLTNERAFADCMRARGYARLTSSAR